MNVQKRHENDTPTPFKNWRHLDPQNDTKCRKRHDLATLKSGSLEKIQWIVRKVP